jgi:ATP-dependent Lhr-like helicase
MLRSLRNEPSEPESTVLAASDTANPYGSLLPWTKISDEEEKSAPHAMARVSGASVVLVNGQLAAFLRRKNPAIKVFLPEAEPERSHFAAKLARQLAELAVKRQQGRRSGLLIAKINEIPARQHPLAAFLEEAGFTDSAGGYYMRRVAAIAKPIAEDNDDEIAEDASETA